MSWRHELAAIVLACAPSVAPETTFAIIQHESGGNPFAIGINRGDRLERQPRSIEEAVSWARWLQERGMNFDAGLMQINSENWAWLGLSPETVFDPCTNIAAGAKVLMGNYERAVRTHGHGQEALRAALSAYNTGSMTRGITNGYVARVERAAERQSTQAVVSVPPLRSQRNGSSPSSPAFTPPAAEPERSYIATGVAAAPDWQSAGSWESPDDAATKTLAAKPLSTESTDAEESE